MRRTVQISVIIAVLLALALGGAVFYLNGTELLRLNMPDGPIAFDTPATIGVRDDV